MEGKTMDRSRPARRLLLLGLVLGAFLAPGRGATGAPLPLPDGGLLCHPRPAGADSLPRLAAGKWLYVNGHLGRAETILAEGRPLRRTADGRFAAQVPWPADRVLRLNLEHPDSVWTFHLRLAEPAADAPPDSQKTAAPRELPARVRLDGSPLSTAPGASYWIFPQAGTEWIADQRRDGWLRLPMSSTLAAWVPERRVAHLGPAPPEPPEPRWLGPAVQTRRLEQGDLELSLAVSGDSPPLWREEGTASGGWRFIFPRMRGRLDWVQLDEAGDLRQLDWEPLAGDELSLRADLAPGAFQGHSLRWEPGRLIITFQRRASSLKEALIVLDPGHGGGESGAIGASGVMEKDLALLLARELKTELERAGAEVRLTRDGDSTLSLGDRVAQARELRADLLLSLHYNSVGEGEDPWKSDGFMVFSWSPWSAEAAQLLHEQLKRRLPLRDRGLHWRSLGVCRHHGCPAILLEAGSLAHPGEEEWMLDPHVRRKQVKAIRRGIEAWLREGR
ncbi:MAG: N-acetylmuramoyl-L-alanine amidase [bacterium]|nr:N-acetylmuramoyl-L-alanine amidase [bacterium]